MTQMDDGACLYYKLTYKLKGSGELKRQAVASFCFTHVLVGFAVT